MPPRRGDPIVYMPLAAFGLYKGIILAVRADGTVDIGLHKLGGVDQHIDLQLTKIDVALSREFMKPGTCLVVDEPTS